MLLWTTLFPAGLLTLGAVLIAWNVLGWRRWRNEPPSLERDFRRRQFRRRIQASGLLTLMAPAVYFGQRIDRGQDPSRFVFWWCGLAGLVLWLVLLALADALSTLIFSQRVIREDRTARALLRTELARQAQAARDSASPPPAHNGRPPEPPSSA